ncbi:hypothetical protein BDR22DRAFT_878960 [Usnea florida]
MTSNYEWEKNRNRQRVPGTCMWLLEHKKFLDWLREPTGSLLWDDDPDRQNSAKAICAILHQLFIQKPGLLQYAVHSFQYHGGVLYTMFNELWGILEQCAADPTAGEIVCVLDALDECKEEPRNELIQKLTLFYSSQGESRTNLRFLATSRPYADIERAFHRGTKDMTSIRLRGEEESEQISKEIDLVIDVRVPHICGAREPPFELDVQRALISGLKRFQNRTYLWLHLTLDVIENTLESTTYDLEKLINRLPRRVEDAYEGILRRLSASGHVEDARSLLHIVVAALRPLTLGEIQIALAVNKKLERGEHCESYNDLVLQSEDGFRVKLRNLCGLFLSIVDSKVYLIHQTAKEEIVRLLAETQSVDLNLKDQRGTTPLHLAAQNGDTDMVKLLIEKQGVELNLRDKDGRTPLHMAAKNGHARTVKFLVEKQALSPRRPLLPGYIKTTRVLIQKENHVFDFDPSQGVSLLEWALSKGHIELAQC